MKVICENCRGRYRVPDTKLTKQVNRATCRNCGHRLLIPPPTGNEPLEGVLVKAVPATPGPSPSRDIQSPGIPRVPRAPARTMPPSALSWEEGPATQATERRPPPHGAARGTPLPAPSTIDGGLRRSQAPSSPRVSAPPREPAFDPAGDMTWALFGTAATLFGAVLLSLLTIVDHDGVMWIGLALAFGGSVLTLMLMMTGQRGRKPAKRLVSVGLALLSALLLSSAVVGTKIGAERLIGGELKIDVGGIAQTPKLPAFPPVAAAPAPAEPAQGDDGGLEPTVGIGGPAFDDEPAVEAPPLRPESRPEPQPMAALTIRDQPGPASALSVTEAPAPLATGPADDSAPSALHIQAVETMLRNNLGVKQCFVPLHRAGKLPRRVEVKFNILPDGTATGVQIESPESYRESDLQKCMAKAIPAIRFPETSGKGTTITYPFILQMR